jgi:biotin carboxyl carrier protein
MIDVALSAEAWTDVEPGTEALLDHWLVRAGDRVRAGQTMAVVVLVKASLDVAAPAEGTVSQILVEKDDTFKPGQALARITTDA